MGVCIVFVLFYIFLATDISSQKLSYCHNIASDKTIFFCHVWHQPHIENSNVNYVFGNKRKMFHVHFLSIRSFSNVPPLFLSGREREGGGLRGGMDVTLIQRGLQKLQCHQGSISSTCLRAAFTRPDPKSTKNSQAVFCVLAICVRKSWA